MAIAIFVNGAKGHSALQLCRDLDCQYKTAFVLAHKLREAMASERRNDKLSGEVEVDGAYFGGYVKPANRTENRVDRRLADEPNRQTSGCRRHARAQRHRVALRLQERSAVDFDHRKRVDASATIYADEAAHWDMLHARFLTKRINHRKPIRPRSLHQSGGELLHPSPPRGNRHSSPYQRALSARLCRRNGVAREQPPRVSNGEQYLMATGAALGHPVSRQWKGYWQHVAR